MKISDHERGPLVKRRKDKDNPGRPGVAARLRKDGITHLTPAQVCNRMRDHDLTYEEAIKYQPMTASERGRAGRKNTQWGRWVPEEERAAKKEAERKSAYAPPRGAK